MYYSSLGVALGRKSVRRISFLYFTLFEDWCTPVAELFQLTANNLEIDLLHFLGNRSYLAIADRSVVHRGDRSDLGTCTAEESFFGDVEFCSVDAANLYRDVQDLLCQNHNRVSGNAREEIVGFRRRDELSTSNNKDVLRAALRYVAIVGKDYGFVVAVV